MTGDLELAQEGMAAILRLMGRDPETEPELRETPERAVRALLDVGTYSTVPDSHADTLLSKRFKGGKRGTVCVGPIHFDSLCEESRPVRGAGSSASTRAWRYVAPKVGTLL